MLKELKAVEAVTVTPAGRLRAQMRYYSASELDEDSLTRYGSVLSDVGGTLAENLFREEPRTRFEGRATNAQVPRALRRAFRGFIEERGMQFLEDVDRWLSEHEKKKPDEKTARLGIGVYFIQDD
jgi:hypothetical protein